MTNKLVYYFWGYLHDKVTPNNWKEDISSPDGNWSYSWAILHEFQKRGWETYCIVDRDKDSVEKYGIEAFGAFSKIKRFETYKKIKFIGKEDCLIGRNMPSADLVLMEFRFPTKDNLLNINDPNFSPDLLIQEALLKYYDKNKIVIFDLDLKFTPEDYKRIQPKKVLQTALYPTDPKYTSVFIPFDFTELAQFPTMPPYNNRLLTYIGSDYSRRENIEKHIIPFAEKHPGCVHIIGNWMKESQKDFRDKCKGIVFYDRIGARKFRDFYQRSVCVPLLLPKNYEEIGFMTMRILETILFASIPIGFDSTKGIDKFLPPELIVSKDNPLDEIVGNLARQGLFDRLKTRYDLIERLNFMDVSPFVDEVLK